MYCCCRKPATKIPAAPPAAKRPASAAPAALVNIVVEKDVIISGGKVILVRVPIPSAPDLELSWDVTVVRSDLGFAAKFLRDGVVSPLAVPVPLPSTSLPSRGGAQGKRPSGKGAEETKEEAASVADTQLTGVSLDLDEAPLSGVSSMGPEVAEERKAAPKKRLRGARFLRSRKPSISVGSEQGSSDGSKSPTRSWAGRFKKPSRRKSEMAALAQQDVSPEQVDPGETLVSWEKIQRGETGSCRFDREGGTVVFTLDNSAAEVSRLSRKKGKKKRVKFRFVVETVSASRRLLEDDLEKLRSQVLLRLGGEGQDQEGYLLNELNLKRFLEARPTFEAAVEMLTNTMRWRQEGRYLGGCVICPKVPGAHTFRQIGFDRERRPVIFFSATQVSPRVRGSYTPFEALLHLVHTLENGHKCMEPDAARGFTWVADLQGVSFADCRTLLRLTGNMEGGAEIPSPRGGKSKRETLISVLADHYPQTLGSCVMLRPPRFVNAAWSAVRAFIDPVTARQFYFVRTAADIHRTFDSLFPNATASWLREEIQLVQDAAALDEQGQVRRAFRGPDFWRPPDPVSGRDPLADPANGGLSAGPPSPPVPRPSATHDSRGSPEYVARFCCRLEDRSDADKLHEPHPNIYQHIDRGFVGVSARSPPPRQNLDA